MKLPLAAALLSAALGAPFAPATAAPAKPPKPPSCHLVKDPTSDATPVANGVASPRSDDAMDVVELDVASDFKQVTGVVRFYALSRADYMAPTGRLVTLTYTAKGRTYAVRTLFGATGDVTTDVAGVKATVDTTAFELRLSGPLTALGIKGLTAKDRFTRLDATTVRWNGDLDTGSQVGDVVDTAGGTFSYAHGSTSCVRVGS